MSIIAIVISAFSIILVSSPKSHDSTHEKEYFSILKSGFRFITKESLVLRLIIFVSVIHALGGAIDEFFPIFGDLTHIQKSGIAIFIGAMSAAEAIASFWAYKFEKLSARFFSILLMISGVLFYIAATMLNISSLVLLVIFSGLYVINSVVIESKIQHLIPSDTRATVSSLQGFMVEVLVLIVYFGFGALAQAYEYNGAFKIFGLVVIGFGLIYLLTSLFAREKSA